MADEKKPQKRAPIGPRPCYVLFSGDNAELVKNCLADGSLTLVETTRKAEDALDAVDSGKAGTFLRLMVK